MKVVETLSDNSSYATYSYRPFALGLNLIISTQ